MNFRPTLFQFESRENPSLPVLDPIGGTAPPSTDPALTPTTTDTTTTVIVTTTTTPPAPFDVFMANNSIYNVPLVQ